MAASFQTRLFLSSRKPDDVPVSTEGALSVSETARGHHPPRFRMGVALEVIGGARLPPRRPRETTPSHRSRHSGEASPWGRGRGTSSARRGRNPRGRSGGKPPGRSTTSCRRPWAGPPSGAASPSGFATSAAAAQGRRRAAKGGRPDEPTRRRAPGLLGAAGAPPAASPGRREGQPPRKAGAPWPGSVGCASGPREPGLRGREGREGARPGGPRGQPPAREAPHGRDGREAPPPASVPIRARPAFRAARLPLEGQGRLVSQPGAVGRRRLRPGRGAPHVPHRRHRLAWPPRRLLTP